MGHEGEDICRRCSQFAFDCECYGVKCTFCLERHHASDMVDTMDDRMCESCKHDLVDQCEWCEEDLFKDEAYALTETPSNKEPEKQIKKLYCNQECASEHILVHQTIWRCEYE